MRAWLVHEYHGMSGLATRANPMRAPRFPVAGDRPEETYPKAGQTGGMQSRSAEDTMFVAGRYLERLFREPELVAGVVVAVLLLVALGMFLWRRLSRTRSDRFLAALADRQQVSVLMHPNPDPDSMASAMAVAALAGTVDTDATIQYAGEIRHSENRAGVLYRGVGVDRPGEGGDGHR